MSRADDARARIGRNPFYVLGLATDCSRTEMEREGAKLLGMLELGMAAAAVYASPLGTHDRTPELVRESMAELRDPDRRLRHELWARASATAVASAPDGDTGAADPSETAPGWAAAMVATGWRSR